MFTPEDKSLVLRYIGMVLAGRNTAQTLLSIMGKGGCGKGTLVRILLSVLNKDLNKELRPEHLDGRFEFRSLNNIKLLTIPDGDKNLLLKTGSEIKSLIGGDYKTAELKSNNKEFLIYGDKPLIITSNNRLIIPSENDSNTWGRRLLLVEAKDVGKKEVIINYHEELLKEEGSAILNLFLEYYNIGWTELNENGRFTLTQKQKNRVSKAVNTANSVQAFINNAIEKGKNKHGILSTDFYTTYTGYCESEGLNVVTEPSFKRQFATKIQDKYNVKSCKLSRTYGDDRIQKFGYKDIKYTEVGCSFSPK